MPRRSRPTRSTGKACGELERRDAAGFFEGKLAIRKRQPIRYHAAQCRRRVVADRSLLLRPGARADGRLLSSREGSHLRLFDKLGAHPIEHEGVDGVHFAVWAPNARRVSVVGDFNDWDGRRHPMRLRQRHRHLGNLRSRHRRRPGLQVSRSSAPGRQLLPLKADPFAFRSELRPATASVTDRAARP